MGRWRDWRTLRLPGQMRLVRAAGISTISLVCNGDMWKYILNLCENVEIPIEVSPDSLTTQDSGFVTVILSGTNLVKILRAMRTVWTEPAVPNSSVFTSGHKFALDDRAIAKRVYLGIAQTVDSVERRHRGTTLIAPITIDDRPPPKS